MDLSYKQKLKNIRCFVFDVDGVLTNGMLHITTEGNLLRAMNIKDGYAMQLAIKKGYQLIIISGGKDEGVRIRLQKLGIQEVHLAVPNKLPFYLNLMNQQKFTPEQVLYMGDDMPDLEVMKHAGLACCPKDAIHQIKSSSHYVSPFNGGEGCVRDVIEQVLILNNHWE
jgi:3-deoxy-D-manno-octulosonate 8-phosphate phosphatase (KDO 8-P phosphatase)